MVARQLPTDILEKNSWNVLCCAQTLAFIAEFKIKNARKILGQIDGQILLKVFGHLIVRHS